MLHIVNIQHVLTVDGVRACLPYWAFSISQGTLPWQPIESKNRRFSRTNHLCRAAILKTLYRMKIIYFSTLCTILVTFGPEIPKFMLLTITPFAVIRQKSAYHATYLKISWTYLDLLYRFGRRIGGDDYPDIRLAVANGALLWQPVKFGRCLQTSQATTFTLCFSVRQRIGRS